MASLANVIFCFPVAWVASKMCFFGLFATFSVSGLPGGAARLWAAPYVDVRPDNVGELSKIFPPLFVFAYFRLFWVFFWSVCLSFCRSSNAARRGCEGTADFPMGEAQETKWPTVSHFEPQHTGLCPSPNRAPGAWKASRRRRALISHWETLPVPSTFWHRHAGLRLYKGWKQRLLLKERLCCFTVSSSPHLLLHFIQCSLINQSSSSKLHSLSSGLHASLF